MSALDKARARLQAETTPAPSKCPTPPPAVLHEHEWPAPPADEAYYGLAGDIVRTIAPHTEADPVALLAQTLVMFGNLIGRHPHHCIGSTPHRAILFATLVGSSATGRKGTSYDEVRPLFRDIEPDWLMGRTRLGGLSSAEGLLWQVRDAIEGGDNPDDGELDKRLMLTEPEFANLLKQSERQGNTVSPYIRQLFDSPEKIHIMTKTAAIHATEPHVSLIGHITPAELARYLTATESANGFANRFLFLCVRRAQSLPFGGQADDWEMAGLRRRLELAAGYGQHAGRVDWHQSTRSLWAAVYPILSGERPGLVGDLTARAAPIAIRLAMLYALLDHSAMIHPAHLMAALSLWDFAERSVGYLFGDKTGSPMADVVRDLLRLNPQGLTRTEIVDATGRHAGDRLPAALSLLLKNGQARYEKVQTRGRPAEIWHATEIGNSLESQLLKIARNVFRRCEKSEISRHTEHASTPFSRFSRLSRTGTEGTRYTQTATIRHRKPGETWLVQQLAAGPLPVETVRTRAKAAGLQMASIKRIAENVLEVVIGGPANAPTWALPPGIDIGAYPTAPDAPNPPAPTLVDVLPGPAEVVTDSAHPGDAKPRRRRRADG